MTEEKRQRRPMKVYSAQEKSQAILSVWSSRRKPAAACKALGINWAVLNNWEKTAFVGMLRALGPEEPVQGQGPELGRRLEKLLAGPEKAVEAAVAKAE